MEVSTDARRRSVDADGASGVDGAGSVKVNVCTVEAGCRVEAMISTSRVNESCDDEKKRERIRPLQGTATGPSGKENKTGEQNAP